MLLGLVRPTAGSAFLLGKPIGHVAARARVGFLPEHFRFHEWLRADEFLDLHGQLYGMSKANRDERIPRLIDLVDLRDAATRRLSTFSKGMIQRIGLAMALLPRPELVFLDEPTSGLDPFGRLLVRDVIRAARAEGTTVFLNSHLLSEVEVTCDRVAFIRHGRVVRAGSMAELSAGLVSVRLRLESIPPTLLTDLAAWSDRVEQMGEHEISLSLAEESQVADLNVWLVNQGVRVLALAPQQLSLEQLFLEIMEGGPTAEESVA
jgi:ABC-2 type transport system ATP-binding protein